ncbi:MAG TPA: serine/threonine-protein kinase, partial [Thermoanaerobaculia bacterium]|nr:serine/threonine-protein kinase [Thermoanaerobaculia bacterium]
MTFASGETVGRYRILRPLGAGAMGVVYLAEDPQIERQLAIKTLHRTLSVSPEDTRAAAERRERLLREARTAGRLIHPNVVTLFDAGEHEGTLFLAFEYVEGQSLDKVLDKRQASGEAMTTAEALRIAREAATGLAFAHARGVVHRDVKPANLLLAGDGRVKVSDFGIAKMAGQATELTMTGTVVGSPHYLSPEQVRGEALDGRSDLFSLGVVLYELLGGRRPFDGDTLTTLVFQILHQPPPPMPLRPGLAPGLTEVLSRFLAKDRDERYGSAEEAVAALEGLERDLAPEVLAAPAVAAEVLEPTHLLSMTGPLAVSGAAAGASAGPGATRPAELPGEPPGTRPARAAGEGGGAAAAPAEGAGTGGRRKLWIAAAVVLALLAVAVGVAGVVAVVWLQERAEQREAALLADAPEGREGEDGTGGEDEVSASGTGADQEGDPAADGAAPERADPLRPEPAPASSQAPAATGAAPPRPEPSVPPAPSPAPPPAAASDRETEPRPTPAVPAEPEADPLTAGELREELRDRPGLRRAVKELVEERVDQRVDTGMSVTFQVQPRDAFVLLDGTVIGRASDHDPRAGGRPFVLPAPGLYRVKLRSPGMADHLILLRAQERGAAPTVV